MSADAKLLPVPGTGKRAWITTARVSALSRQPDARGGENTLFPNGLTVITAGLGNAPVSATITTITGEDGGYRDIGVALAVPSPAPVAVIAKRRHGSGSRRVARALAASGPPFASYRANINTGGFGAVMVWNRYQTHVTSTHYFRSDSALGQIFASPSGYVKTRLQASNNYRAGTLINGFDPNGTIDRGSCGTTSVGFSMFGFSVSETFNACSQRVIGLNNATNNYYVEWQGRTGNVPDVASVVATRNPRGVDDRFTPTMWARWCYGITSTCPAWRVGAPRV